MKDMGKKEKSLGTVEKDKPPEIRYPSFTICSAKLPEVADYKIGDKIRMEVECEVTGTSKAYDKTRGIECQMDMTKAEVLNKKESRKEADRLGLDKEDYENLKSKSKKE